MTLDLHTGPDGTMLLRPQGIIGEDEAIDLRQALVQAIRRARPTRLVVDLADVDAVDPINAGALSAVCGLGDDHQVAVFLDNPSSMLAAQLISAGVPAQRLRHVRKPISTDDGMRVPLGIQLAQRTPDANAPAPSGRPETLPEVPQL